MNRHEKNQRIAEQTAIRHQLLRNGYTPLPNLDKRCVLKGWSTIDVTRDVIDEWAERKTWLATGIRVEDDLLALDFDIDNADMLDRIWDAIAEEDERLTYLMNAMPTRGGKGNKVCLFCRLATGQIDKLWSKAFYHPADLKQHPDSATLHRLEVFSGRTRGRQIGIYGPHTVDRGEVLIEYRWADGIGLCEIPREELPALRRKDVLTIVDITSQAMADAGWVFEAASRSGKIVPVNSYTLTPDMTFDTNDGRSVRLEELESLVAETPDLRVSLSFAEGTSARNTTRGLVAINPVDDRVQIWDSATDKLYRPNDMDMRLVSVHIGNRLQDRRLLTPAKTLVDQHNENENVNHASRTAAVDVNGRRIVPVDDGRIAEATWAVAEWLAASPDLYQSAGQVALVDDSDSIIRMSDSRLAVEIGSRVCCTRKTKRGKDFVMQEVDPPIALVRQVASVVKEAPFRKLRGIVDVPILRSDGTLVEDNGWDSRTGLLVRGAGHLAKHVPENPTREDALAALGTLMRPFREYKFAGAESRGAFLAALLTACVRPALRTAPAFAIDAPVAGSGKTKLGMCLMALAGRGRTHAPLVFRNEEEVKKVLLSVLVQQPGAVLFDNQAGAIQSNSLAAVLTMPQYSERRLGATETVTVDTNTLIMFSGNNLAIVGDMTRRVLVIRIDPECETPANRVFGFDPLQEVETNRNSMLASGLTLLRWGIAHRAGHGRIGSFEEWDRIVGQTVAVLDPDMYADPANVLESATRGDMRAEENGVLLGALYRMFGSEPFSARDLSEALKNRVAGACDVLDVIEDNIRVINPVTLGRFLFYRKDARVGGMRLEFRPSRNTHRKPHEYAICAQDPDVIEMGSWHAQQKRTAARVSQLSSSAPRAPVK